MRIIKSFTYDWFYACWYFHHQLQLFPNPTCKVIKWFHCREGLANMLVVKSGFDLKNNDPVAVLLTWQQVWLTPVRVSTDVSHTNLSRHSRVIYSTNYAADELWYDKVPIAVPHTATRLCFTGTPDCERSSKQHWTTLTKWRWFSFALTSLSWSPGSFTS